MNILDEIVRHKKKEVAAATRSMPVSRLFEQARTRQIRRQFRSSLTAHENVAVVAEIKKASPSAGIIRADFDPVSIANAYAAHGAAAISVLTDSHYFKGKLEYLEDVRQAVDLPLLRKDFIIEPYQVIEAEAYGADAILLIMNCISKGQFLELCATATESKLDVLVEVHSYAELDRALCEDVKLVGINNRDLSTFTVDLTTTEKLAAIVPPDATMVAESGIKGVVDISRLSRTGIDAVLVGETLMREDDFSELLQECSGVPKCSR